MKSDTLFTLGAVAIGGYAVYRLLSPVEETAKQIGSGIGTAFQETGSAIGEVTKGISSPFEYVDTAISGAAKSRSLKSDIARRGYEAAAPYSIATQVSKTKSKSIKQDKKTQFVEQDYNTTMIAQGRNFSEQAQRKTEYGSSLKEYGAKMFLPTTDVAQERRIAASKTLKKVVSAPAKVVVAAKDKAKSLLSSVSKKLKKKSS